jgi:hypothetical protein
VDALAVLVGGGEDLLLAAGAGHSLDPGHALYQ